MFYLILFFNMIVLVTLQKVNLLIYIIKQIKYIVSNVVIIIHLLYLLLIIN